MKQISYENRKLTKKDKKLKNLHTKALEKIKQCNNEINEKENMIIKLEKLHMQDLERLEQKVKLKETEINNIHKSNKSLNKALNAKTKQLIDYMNRDQRPSRSR